MNNNYQEMFHDGGARSPAAHRFNQQGLHRQGSRQFDAYGQMNNQTFNPEERFDGGVRFDRMNPTLGSGGFANFEGGGAAGAQTWNANAFRSFNTFDLTRSMKSNVRGRNNLPSTWMDQPVPPMPNLSQLGGIGHSVLGNPQSVRNEGYQHHESDEELIPTAIVIKNIPFAVKKEQLVELMTSMSLPLPYAFNYHFDNGVFRGLAFANFTSPDETASVIEQLNHFELHGRKLRVEYKKMLPQQERERIEREKRERRGQLEEQHRPLPSQTLQNQQSMSSLSSHVPATSPSPVSSRNNNNAPAPNLNLNDPETLQFYNEIFMFKSDTKREALIFPATLSPPQRRLVHTIAHFMGLSHASRGNGDQRQVHVYRDDEHISPLPQQGLGINQDPNRRALNRAATTEFAESIRSDPTVPYSQLRGQQSNGFLGIPDSPGGFLNQSANLRAAKSFADLRSYSPSPAQSTASFPVGLQSNIARFQDMGLGGASSNKPALNGPAPGLSHESLITNGLSNMTIGTNSASGGSPRRARTGMPWDEASTPTAPIGANRPFMNNFDDSRDRNSIHPSRQPRGPAVERATGFGIRPRQNGHQQRNSDELRQQTSSNLASVTTE